MSALIDPHNFACLSSCHSYGEVADVEFNVIFILLKIWNYDKACRTISVGMLSAYYGASRRRSHPARKCHAIWQVMSWKYKCIAAFSAGPRFCGGTFFQCCSFLRFASGQSDALPALSMGSAGCEQWIRVAYNRAEGIATKLGPWLFVWLVCVKRLYSHCVILPMHNNLCVGYQV